MGKLKIHQFDPVIYPRKIWIVKGCTEAQIKESFADQDGKPLGFDKVDKCKACVWTVSKKDNDLLGVLVYIRERLTVMDIAHEAVHCANKIFDDCGIGYALDDDEHMAYMVGFCADCINQVNTGKFKG